MEGNLPPHPILCFISPRELSSHPLPCPILSFPTLSTREAPASRKSYMSCQFLHIEFKHKYEICIGECHVVRWTTENEYTSFSCFHTDCFGCAVGSAECMRRRVDAGENVDLLAESKQWARVLKGLHYMPLAEAKKEADEAIASGLNTH